MTRLVVDLDQLLGAVERMRRFQEHLARTHDVASRRMGDLHVVWTGDAADAQAAAQRHWSAAADQVHEALAALTAIASAAHANYAVAAAANRRMWSA
ncbi:MAG TPA: WXG100 family type VII secretion target [Jatrophihabitans sp.]|nr:WXG100 family type VII secretion target [Jatrophihabitans sp.]